MKKGIFNAVLAAVLTSAVLALPIINAQSGAEEESKSEKVDRASAVIVENNKKENNADSINEQKNNRIVHFIVEVDGDSLIDKLNRSGGKYKNVTELIQSDDGRQCLDDIKKNQAVVKASIQKIITDSDFSGSYTYTAGFNGFSVKAPYGSYEKLLKIKGVKSVIVGDNTQYTADEETDIYDGEEDDIVSDEPNEEMTDDNDDTVVSEESEENEFSDSADTADTKATVRLMSETAKNVIKANDAYQSGFTGGSTLIAVIDDEFDCSHSIFSALPSFAKYSESELNSLFSAVKFNISENYGFKDVYKSGKIVFAYDYADNDNETYSDGDGHGTHIAGFAAGNNGKSGNDAFKGVAYDAQLALMKVSSDSESSNGEINSFQAVFAAMDDAVKLGADVINCSFGSARNLYGSALYSDMVRRLYASGVQVVVSSGNHSYNGSPGVLNAEYADYSTISDLGLIEECFTASACDNAFDIITKIKCGGQSFDYTEKKSQDDQMLFRNQFASGIDYLYMASAGYREDYENINVSGKAVVLDSGDISPDEQAENAVENGAAAVILITDERAETNEAKIPFLCVSSDAESYFLENAEGKAEPDSDLYIRYKDDVSISEFSSYGVTPELKLKPDITAPGEDTLSATDNDGYAVVSGTSTAAPTVSGAFVIVKQYLAASEEFSSLTKTEQNDMIKAVVMSNADVFKIQDGEEPDSDNDENEPTAAGNTDNTLYASPRVSGAGLINLNRALTSDSYLSAVSSGSAKAEPGDSISGDFEFDIVIHNMSDKAKKYTPSAAVQTDSFEIADDQTVVNTLEPYSLSDYADISFEVNGKPSDSINVAARSEQKVHVKIKLSASIVLAYSQYFKNGFYVDGYLFFRANDNTVLNMPMTSFCGDWSKIDIFDRSVYEGEKSITGFANTLYAAADLSSNTQGCQIGINEFTGKAYTENIAVGKDTVRNFYDDMSYGNSYILPDFYMLRDAYDFTVTVSSTDGKVLYTNNFGNVGSFFDPNKQPYQQFPVQCAEMQKFFSGLSEGQYIYTFGAKTMNSQGELTEEQIKTFSFVVDNTAPTDVSDKIYEKGGKIYLELTAKDETALQGFRLYTASYNEETQKYDYADPIDNLIRSGYISEDTYRIEKIKNNDNGTMTFVYDITNLHSEIGKLSVYHSSDVINPSPLKVVYKAVDYAYNSSNARTADTVLYGSAELTFIDQNHKPVRDVEVSIGDVRLVTDENGKVKLEELMPSLYSVQIDSIPEDYRADSNGFLFGISSGHMNYYKTVTFTFEGEYPESTEISDDVSQNEPQESEESLSDQEELTDDKGGNSFYALAFIGTVLLISVGALLLSKYRRNKMDIER